jgi:hypothetical protein
VGISEGFREAQRRELDKLWANFFYKANIPFIVLKNKSFREAMRKAVDFRQPYGLPS